MHPPLARVLLAGSAVGLLWPASHASAGGANWNLDRPAYRPGDTASAHTGISWSHNPSLGRPEDGAFYAYLAPVDRMPERDVSWPHIPSDAIPLGEITIGQGPYLREGPNHARITFVVPDLPDGTYGLLHCNDPCTTSLADIVGGRLVISRAAGPPPPPPLPTTTTVAPTSTSTTSRPTTTTTTSEAIELTADDRDPDASSSALVPTPVALSSLAALSGAGAWALAHRRRPRPSPAPPADHKP